MNKRARIVSGLAALAALFLAPIAEASLTRETPPALEAPSLTLTLAAPEPSEFSLFDGTEIARALASRPAFDLISITTDDAATAVRTRFVSPSELSADELPEGPELVPITSVREQRFNLHLSPDVFGLEPLRGPPGDEASYPKTRYRVFGFLGTPILGELRGVSLELRWGCVDFSCGLSSGTVGWLSQDPLEDRDSPNLYGFVGMRPHEKTDPLGLLGDADIRSNPEVRADWCQKTQSPSCSIWEREPVPSVDVEASAATGNAGTDLGQLHKHGLDDVSAMAALSRRRASEPGQVGAQKLAKPIARTNRVIGPLWAVTKAGIETVMIGKAAELASAAARLSRASPGHRRQRPRRVKRFSRRTRKATLAELGVEPRPKRGAKRSQARKST